MTATSTTITRTLEEKEELSFPPTVPKNWDRCHFYLEQKRRFCRQQRPGDSSSLYCGNHRHLMEEIESGRKRIPCPIDPSHMIFEDALQKHVIICPRAKRRKLLEGQIYYQENINTGGYGRMYSELSSRNEETASLEWAQRLAIRVLETHQRIFNHGTSDKNPKSPHKLTLEDLHGAIPLIDLSQPEISAGMIEGFQTYRIKSGGARHIPQLASLVGHLRSLQVLLPLGKENGKEETSRKETKPLVILEMGAGRGIFGLTAAGVAAASGIPTHLTMVERTGSRSKADRSFRTLQTYEKNAKQTYLKLDTVKWSRIGCDLAHVNLPVVLTNNECDGNEHDARVAVIAKHLCGAGTDLALKSIQSIRGKVDCCLFATCCHGICDWKEYVGRDYLNQAMASDNSISFGPLEFDLMRQWCAGASAGCRNKGATSSGGNSDNNEKDSGEYSSKSGGTTAEADDIDEDDEEIAHTSTRTDADHASLSASNRVNIRAIVESLYLECGIEGLGRACQRLIDFGRVEYLRNVIFAPSTSPQSSSRLIYYVSPDISPQNACLVGKRVSTN